MVVASVNTEGIFLSIIRELNWAVGGCEEVGMNGDENVKVECVMSP